MKHPPRGRPERQALIERLRDRAKFVRLETVRLTRIAGAGHYTATFSAAELFAALYYAELRYRPEQPDWPDRDRFVLSKGHAAIGLYAVLALRGFLPVNELPTFDKAGSRLQGHPDATRLPGLDSSTGSLGQGLSFGVGVALGAQMAGKNFHTFVMLGDGEIQEGMVWEAVQIASRYRLSNLTAI